MFKRKLQFLILAFFPVLTNLQINKVEALTISESEAVQSIQLHSVNLFNYLPLTARFGNDSKSILNFEGAFESLSGTGTYLEKTIEFESSLNLQNETYVGELSGVRLDNNISWEVIFVVNFPDFDFKNPEWEFTGSVFDDLSSTDTDNFSGRVDLAFDSDGNSSIETGVDYTYSDGDKENIKASGSIKYDDTSFSGIFGFEYEDNDFSFKGEGEISKDGLKVSGKSKTVPEPLTIAGTGIAIIFGIQFKRKLAKVAKE